MSPRGRVRATEGWAAVLIVGAALAATLAASDGAASSPARPFEHRRHERVACAACHGTGENHRTILVRTPADCAGCHHDARRALACGTCHAPEALPTRVPVVATLSLSVWRAPATRELAFPHDRHAAPTSGLACRDCHRTPVTLAVDRDCGSCHAPHHRASAECSTCHRPARPGAHGPDMHLGCAGSGCHAAAVAPTVGESRTLCVACHPAQRDHEPHGTCAECHRVPTATPATREAAP